MKAVFEIDPAHSSVQFSVRHMMISNVRGVFTGVKGTVSYDVDNPSATTVHAEIEAATINTSDAQRDAHLKTADFLDVANFPHITFQSTGAEGHGKDLKIEGDLTIHGVTKPVVLKVEEVTPETKDPWGRIKVGASAKTTINRKDFGLTWNAALETGGVMVSEEVKLDFEVQLVKSQATAA